MRHAQIIAALKEKTKVGMGARAAPIGKEQKTQQRDAREHSSNRTRAQRRTHKRNGKAAARVRSGKSGLR